MRVCVTGLWRSGTSLMMQILKENDFFVFDHYSIRDEYNEKGYFEINEGLSESVFYDLMTTDENKAVKVVAPLLKENKIIQAVDYVIFMQRDIEEVIESTNNKWGKSPYKRKLLTIEAEAKAYIRELKKYLFFVNYNQLISDPKLAIKEAGLGWLIKETNSIDPNLYKVKKNGMVFSERRQ